MAKSNNRERLLFAAIDAVRAKGYAAMRIDDLAAAVGVTKGSFFHHFPTKEACARAAIEQWNAQAEAMFAACGCRDIKSPAGRVLAYIDFRIASINGVVAAYSCYPGTLLQEVHETHPKLAKGCANSILNHALTLEPDLAAALGEAHDEARDLAMHVQATIQGALILAKVEGGGHGARASLAHLRRYLEMRMKTRSDTPLGR